MRPFAQASRPLLLLAQNIPAGGILRINLCRDLRSDPTLEIAVHIFAIAIGAFDPALFQRDLEPDTRMPQRAPAPVTGNAVAIDKFRLWCLDRHLGTFPFPVNWITSVMSDEAGRGK